MKKVCLLLAFVFMVFSAKAQDHIMTKDDVTIIAKVLEVGTSEVKYKKWTNQSGPTYTISLSSIKEIIYQNGDKDVFGDRDSANSELIIEKAALKPNQSNNIDLVKRQDLMSKARAYNICGITLSGLCFLGAISYGIATDKIGLAGLMGGLSVIPAAILCTKGSNLKSEAMSIETYSLIGVQVPLGEELLLAPSLNYYSFYPSNSKGLGLGVKINF